MNGAAAALPMSLEPAIAIPPSTRAQDEPGRSTDRSDEALGAAVADAALSIFAGIGQWVTTAMLEPGLRQQAGSLLAVVAKLQLEHADDAGFAAAARTAGRRVLRERRGHIFREDPAEAERLVAIALDGVFDVVEHVVAGERALAN